MTKLLIVYKGVSEFGGIETLIIRIHSYLKYSGYEVKFMLRELGQLEDSLDTSDVIELGAEFWRMRDASIVKKVIENNCLNDIDSVLALDDESALIAPLIAWHQKENPCTAVMANWMPDYFEPIRKARLNPGKFLAKWNLKNNYQKETCLSMLASYIKDGQSVLGKDWQATVFPIPLKTGNFTTVRHLPAVGRIVSVGRLQKMKAYNLFMIEAIDQLVKEGRDVEWHVYGVGSLERQMKARVVELGLSSRVFFRGQLDYEEFPDVLSRTYVFVGQGTALLEAGLAGVPAITTEPFDSTGLSYGLIYKHKLCDFDSMTDRRPDTSVLSEIRRLLDLPIEEYKEEGARCRDGALASSEEVVMPRLIRALKARPVIPAGFVLYKCLLSWHMKLRDLVFNFLKHQR